MHFITKITTLSLVMYFSSSYSATPIDGLYYSGFGGASIQPGNVDVTYNNALVNQARYNTGYDAGGNIGYKAAFFRYEAEVTYFNTPIQRFAVNRILDNNPKGYNQGTLAYINLLYDFPYQASRLVQPFIGGGIGYAWIHNNFLNQDNFKFDVSNYAFTYQGIAGLSYHFAENYSLFFAYRYAATTHLNSLGNIFQANMLNGGATYRFDSCEYK
jgi:opacity protein-like surface antigen